jgi:hypothetical protein
LLDAEPAGGSPSAPPLHPRQSTRPAAYPRQQCAIRREMLKIPPDRAVLFLFIEILAGCERLSTLVASAVVLQTVAPMGVGQGVSQIFTIRDGIEASSSKGVRSSRPRSALRLIQLRESGQSPQGDSRCREYPTQAPDLRQASLFQGLSEPPQVLRMFSAHRL